MNNIINTLLLILISLTAVAQEDDWNDQLLEKIKGTKVIRWEKPANESAPWPVIVKVKKKVGIYTVSISEDQDEDGNPISYVDYAYANVEPQYDQINPFKKIDEEDSDVVDYLQGQNVEVAEARFKKKTGIIVRYGDGFDLQYINASDFFEKIDWESNKGTCVPVMINSKWGIYDWYQQDFLFECDYISEDDLPKTTDPNGFNAYSARIFNAFNKRKDWEEIDNINLDNDNGDGIFLAQSKSTNKYGMYQYLGDEIVEAIPMKYDSLYHFPWNGNYTAVFNDGKVGFYLSYWSYGSDAKQSVPCIYEDYKRYITDDQIPKLAVQKDGKWGWVDWLTGEEKSEFTFDTPDDLPYPHYKQEMWLEE